MKRAILAAAIGLTAMVGAGQAQAHWVWAQGAWRWHPDRVVVTPWHYSHRYTYAVPYRRHYHHWYRY